jgi:hypothetical protein
MCDGHSARQGSSRDEQEIVHVPPLMNKLFCTESSQLKQNLLQSTCEVKIIFIVP